MEYRTIKASEGKVFRRISDGVVFGKEINHEINVSLHIAQHLSAPFLSVAEGCNGGNRGKKRWLIQLVHFEPRVETATYFTIGND